MITAPLPDALPTNWVDRHAPESLRPWLKLGRFDRPAGIWLLLLPGWQGIALACSARGEWPDLRLLILFAVGSALMRAAGCAFNDIVDRDIDAKVARTAARPVASGQISVKGALAFIVGCSLIGLVILLNLNLVCVILGVASLMLVAAYPFMKRITWWPQAWLGLTFNWGALMGYAAVAGGGVATLSSIALYAGGVFWTLGYDTIYAVQDLEDDALAGVKSSARRLGEAAPRGVIIFYLIAIALAVAAGAVSRLGPLFAPILALYGAHLIRQARSLRIDDPAGALKLFQSNREAGLILFAALIAGLWRAGRPWLGG
jgi:4-hydroxybenzoate polyprenyltransferase